MTSLKKLAALLVFLGLIVMGGIPTFAAMQSAADYRSSLTSGITTSATSLTVVSTSTPSGENLIQGAVYGIKLGGREYAIGTLGAGKQFTSVIRGVSLITGTTTGGVPESWGRGTAVEITDAPVVLELLNKIAGRQDFDNAIRYTGVSTGTLALNGNNLASVDYANSLSFGAVPAANETTSGFVELSTQAEAALGTSIGGTSARLALGGNLATSTWNSATAASRVLVTGAGGKLDNNFIATSTLLAATSTISIGAFPAWEIGKQFQIFTSTGTTSFAVPSGIRKVFVEVQAAGGGGVSCATAVSAGGGGGAGGYSAEMVDVSATSSIQVYVPAGGASATTGAWATFGTNGFYLSASGGISGGPASASTASTGGAGGIGSGGDINLSGGAGKHSSFDVANTGTTNSGEGGDARYGGGAQSTSGTNPGNAAGNYGGGGSGGACATSVSEAGGAGGQGIVIVRW